MSRILGRPQESVHFACQYILIDGMIVVTRGTVLYYTGASLCCTIRLVGYLFPTVTC